MSDGTKGCFLLFISVLVFAITTYNGGLLIGVIAAIIAFFVLCALGFGGGGGGGGRCSHHDVRVDPVRRVAICNGCGLRVPLDD